MRRRNRPRLLAWVPADGLWPAPSINMLGTQPGPLQPRGAAPLTRACLRSLWDVSMESFLKRERGAPSCSLIKPQNCQGFKGEGPMCAKAPGLSANKCQGRGLRRTSGLELSSASRGRQAPVSLWIEQSPGRWHRDGGWHMPPWEGPGRGTHVQACAYNPTCSLLGARVC